MRRHLLRLLNVFRHGAREAEVSREIRSHLVLLEDEYRRRGMSDDEARLAARRSLGNIEIVKEQHRDSRSFVWLEDARRDIGHALRGLQGRPLASATIVASLAIGIGANVGIFTVVNTLLFRDPTGVAAPERLVDIGVAREDGGLASTSYPTFLDIGRRATLLESVYAHPMFPGAMALGTANVARAERVYGHYVTPNYFAVLGAAPALGRWFEPTGPPGASPYVVLSHRFWTRRFNQDPRIVGQTIRLDGKVFTIIGVASEGFQGFGFLAADLWLPLTMIGNGRADDPAFTLRPTGWLMVGGRLKPGASVQQAAAEMDAIGKALDREYPNPGGAPGLRLLPSSRVGGNSRVVGAFVALLMVLVGLVLVVACANVGGILLSQGVVRRQEIAVRLAMGASRGRILRQLITETMVLFALAGLSGLALARAITRLVVPRLPALPFPVAVTLDLDGHVVVFTMGLSLASALIFGLAPALQASKSDVVTALKDDSQGSTGHARLRSAFVVAQVAFSMVLVVIAGLFIRALQKAGSTDPGFDPRGVELTTLKLSTAGYTDATGPRFARDLVNRVRQLPAVQAATIALVMPGGFEGIGLGGVTAPGFTPPDGQRFLFPSWNVVEPGYFATLRIPLVAGRDFDDRDGASSQKVAIIGEALARQMWPDRSAVGQLLSHGVFGPGGLSRVEPRLVVGVVRDVKTSSLVDGLAGSFVYLPLQQQYWSNVTIAARSAKGQRLADEIRAVVTTLNPMLPIANTQTLEDSTALGLIPQRVVMSMAGSLGFVGLVLAAIGIYGITAYAVARRTHEFGIRMALGAERVSIVAMVLAQGFGLAAVGCVIGLLIAAGAAQVLSAFLFGHPPLDFAIFGGAAVLFVAVAMAACVGPSIRATRIDPLRALRCQ